jgi:N-acetylglucosaminyl-diphospho-decaprenol L-rhamnosyltransferase
VALPVTAIVVAYRSAGLIGPCLASLAPTPTLVVDNASGDAIAEVVAAHPHATLVPLPANRGFAAGVNAGLARSAGDVLVINPDAQVQPGAVRRLQATLAARPSAGIVAPRLLYPDGAEQPSARTFKSVVAVVARRTPLGRLPLLRHARERHLAPSQATSIQEVDWVMGAGMLVRRAAIDVVGGMDEGFFLYEEDQDWCIRMQRFGWAVLLDPSATFVHDYQRASGQALRLSSPATRAHWRSLGRLIRKYPAMVLLGRSPVRGRTPQASSVSP